MKKAFAFLLSFVAASAITSGARADTTPYCLAIRGNGELQPAHWGAMANVVERLGLPSAMAGGSSSTVSMFWLESMASHPMVKGQSQEIQKQRVSLMMKSLMGFYENVKTSKAWRDLTLLYGVYVETETLDIAERAKILIEARNWEAVTAVLNKGIELGLIDPTSIAPLLSALNTKDYERARFFAEELQGSISAFGDFDAKDDNLFFRPGVANFERAARTFGRIAHFYSAKNADPKLKAYWQQFLGTCAEASVGKTWNALIEARPVCNQHFQTIFNLHFDGRRKELPVENEIAGSVIPVFPTTAILQGTAAKEALAAMKEYQEKLDPHFGKDFQLSNPNDVRFGYWGSLGTLKKIESNLSSNDEKSRRFLPLGSANWKTILTYSPAEPGLAPFKPIEVNGETLVSAGGWSDLHPMLVLKAAGCQDVVYVTRQGGESLFAQGIAKRLLGLERDWMYLRASNEQEKARNNALNDQGEPSDQSTLWSKLYNLANPNSSLRVSLHQASAILCTNWNAYKIVDGVDTLVDHAYRSHFVIARARRSLERELGPSMLNPPPGCAL